MICVTKQEAAYLQKLYPPRKVYDMYTGGRHMEKMVRRTKNHYWCTEIGAVMSKLDEFRAKRAV